MPMWPVTVNQLDNYARKPTGRLPTLNITGSHHPVVQVFEVASGELVYALRLNGQSFQPQVFAPGRYLIKVIDTDANRTITLPSSEATTGNTESLEVKF
jgi:hypothetical protein